MDPLAWRSLAPGGGRRSSPVLGTLEGHQGDLLSYAVEWRERERKGSEYRGGNGHINTFSGSSLEGLHNGAVNRGSTIQLEDLCHKELDYAAATTSFVFGRFFQ